MGALTPIRTTVLLATANVVVFVAMALSGVSIVEPSPAALVDWGALYGPLTIGHQWWRMGSSMFLHFGVLHLALNMLCLLSLGPLAESAFGSLVFLIGYVLTGLGGAITSLAVHPATPGAGASGAIFGTASWLLVTGLARQDRGSDSTLKADTRRLGMFLAGNLLYGLSQPEIDNAAHLGGLATGALLGLSALVGRRKASPIPIRIAFVAVTGLLAVGAIAVARMHPFTSAQRQDAQFLVATSRTAEESEARAQSAAKKLNADLHDRIAALRATIQAHPDSLAAYALLAEAQSLLGNTEEAEVALQEGLARAPGNISLLTALGTLSLNLQRFHEAVMAYEQALAMDSTNADTRFNLAISYQGLALAATEAGDRQKAIAASRRILQLRAAPDLDEVASRSLDSLRAVKTFEADST